MIEITTHKPVNTQDALPPVEATRNAAGDVSESDVQNFLDLLNGTPTEEELQTQFDKNFQTMSYLFMKGIYSNVEDEIRKRQ